MFIQLRCLIGIRVADPAGVYLDQYPDPTLKKKPDPTVKTKHIRIRPKSPDSAGSKSACFSFLHIIPLVCLLNNKIYISNVFDMNQNLGFWILGRYVFGSNSNNDMTI